jgi:RNA polymerase sigma-70 factor (ECF subfamily)
VGESDKNQLEPEHWIERYADYLYSYAFARLHKEQVAEDLVQDTFFSALKARDTFQHTASEKTWLVSILKHKIIDHYRKKSTQNELNIFDKPVDGKDGLNEHFFEDTTSDSPGHWTAAGAPGAWAKDFETSVDSDEFYKILERCIAKMPAKWAAAFTMKNMDDQDTEEICQALGITPSNYWVIMHRAKLHLRDCMAKNWFDQ